MTHPGVPCTEPPDWASVWQFKSHPPPARCPWNFDALRAPTGGLHKVPTGCRSAVAGSTPRLPDRPQNDGRGDDLTQPAQIPEKLTDFSKEVAAIPGSLIDQNRGSISLSRSLDANVAMVDSSGSMSSSFRAPSRKTPSASTGQPHAVADSNMPDMFNVKAKRQRSSKVVEAPGKTPEGLTLVHFQRAFGNVRWASTCEEFEQFRAEILAPATASIAIGALLVDGSSNCRSSKATKDQRFVASSFRERFPSPLAIMLRVVRSAGQCSFLAFEMTEPRSVELSLDFLQWLLIESRCMVWCFRLVDVIREVAIRRPAVLSHFRRISSVDVAAWLINPTKQFESSFELLTSEYTPESRIPGAKKLQEIPEAWAFLLDDLASIETVAHRVWQQVQTAGLENAFLHREMPLALALCQLQVAGFPFDEAVLGRERIIASGRLKELESQAFNFANGREVPLTSPAKLSQFLFSALPIGLGLRPPAWATVGANGHISTSRSVLEAIVDQHAIVRVVLEHRCTSKLINAFLEPLHPVRGEDASLRVYTEWHHTATSTGRLSSSHPNLQQIPRPDPNGPNIRRAFSVSSSGRKLLSFDYKQVELRILADLSGAKQLLAAFREDRDVYCELAGILQRKRSAEVTEADRRKAKVCCLAMIYGSGTSLLARQMDVDQREAAEFKAQFFRLCPEVPQWSGQEIKKAEMQGGVIMPSGRQRFIAELQDPTKREEGKRQVVNTLVQGTAADVMKSAIIRIHRWLSRSASGSNSDPPKMLLTVHDEILLECDASAVQEVAAVISKLMVDPQIMGSSERPLQVPLRVNVQVGDNWGTMIPLEVTKGCTGSPSDIGLHAELQTHRQGLSKAVEGSSGLQSAAPPNGGSLIMPPTFGLTPPCSDPMRGCLSDGSFKAELARDEPGLSRAFETLGSKSVAPPNLTQQLNPAPRCLADDGSELELILDDNDEGSRHVVINAIEGSGPQSAVPARGDVQATASAQGDQGKTLRSRDILVLEVDD